MATHREAKRYSREKVSPRWQAAEGNRGHCCCLQLQIALEGWKGYRKCFLFAHVQAKPLVQEFSVTGHEQRCLMKSFLLSDGFEQDGTLHNVKHGNWLHDPSFSCRKTTLISSKSLLVILNFYILIISMFSPCPCRCLWKLGPAYPQFDVSTYICSVLNFCILRPGCIHHRQE